MDKDIKGGLLALGFLVAFCAFLLGIMGMYHAANSQPAACTQSAMDQIALMQSHDEKRIAVSTDGITGMAVEYWVDLKGGSYTIVYVDTQGCMHPVAVGQDFLLLPK